MLFSLLINVIYLYQLKGTPLYSQLVIDEQGYFDKANLILSKGWVGDRIFYQDQLYPYFIALSIKPFGPSLTVRKDEAELQFEKAIRLNPDYFKASNSLGLLLFENGRANEAIPFYRKALSLNPSDSNVSFSLGMALFELEQIDETLYLMNSALVINPKYIQIHAFFGHIHLNSGKISEAIAHFLEILKLDPGNANAHYNLGVAFKKKGMIREGENEINIPLSIDPKLLASQK